MSTEKKLKDFEKTLDSRDKSIKIIRQIIFPFLIIFAVGYQIASFSLYPFVHNEFDGSFYYLGMTFLVILSFITGGQIVGSIISYKYIIDTYKN